MSYEDPRAYLVGLEGQALLRAFAGEYDREFVEARLAEVRRLLDDPGLAAAAVDVQRVGTVDGYRAWAPGYDTATNPAFALEAPVVHALLDGLPAGRALDAACGSGRHASYLVGLGYDVVGVDSSPDMLALARGRVPGADFRDGDLHRLPLPDDDVDLVVCALALTHVADIGPVLAEFARVLRPGGHLVVSDMHHDSIARCSVPTVRAGDGRPGRLAAHRHRTGDYLRAALPAGLRVLRCEEPTAPGPPDGAAPAPDTGPWDVWPWSLAAMVPDAARAAHAGDPGLIVWLFRRD